LIVLLSQFRASLSRALGEAANKFEAVAEDGRIGPLLTHFHKQSSVSSSDFVVDAADRLTPEHIQHAADHHMPLCMKVALTLLSPLSPRVTFVF
jgi:hypothetical protein